MKNKHKLVLCIFTVVMITGSVVGQHGTSVVRRVKFARGRTTAVLQGTIQRGVSNDYLLGARRGQDMTVHLASRGDVSFTILTPSGQSLSDFSRDWSGSLPESGDYRINVLPPTQTNASASYTLEITIR
ncbi:MAG TPA: hypothetical protein VI306_14350 [Pyrinomonadaceae bacterium]